MTWIQTYSGGTFVLSVPCASDVRMEDVGHALAHLCRFNGHTVTFYSVAQHCVLMAEEMPNAGMALHALLHDAAEAYVGDVMAPVKEMVPEVAALEERVLAAIYAACGVPLPGPVERELIHRADMRMLASERECLMRQTGQAWPCLQGVQPFDLTIRSWDPVTARSAWIAMLEWVLPAARDEMSEN